MCFQCLSVCVCACQHASEDTLRLLSEEAVMSEVCDASSVLHVKVVMAVICWEWPRSSCSLSPV